MVNLEVIDIEWEGPFNIHYDRDEDLYGLNYVPDALLNNSGFYQIYGRHPVYGRDVLLYIGETKENEDGNRTFKTRLKEHFSHRFYYHTNLSIFLGPSNLSGDEIKLVESILIFSHIPALNRQHLDSPKKGAESILIRNWGFLGSLESSCTGYWDE